ncbi:hypothetical protein [Ornithinimicrobium kibberense]
MAGTVRRRASGPTPRLFLGSQGQARCGRHVPGHCWDNQGRR